MQWRVSFLVFGLFFAALGAGCGAVTSDASATKTNADGGDLEEEERARSVGTKPPDGAPGICCPASIGGCAKVGGYRADGVCTGNELCDNMCEQRIVADEHGCNKLTYKRPPVATAFAGPQSCDDPRFNGGGTSGGGGTPSTPPSCPYPHVDNDALCPLHYARAYAGQPCPRVGMECWYPGEGDGPFESGCFATALLACSSVGGPSIDDDDAGPDAGPGTWTAAQ